MKKKILVFLVLTTIMSVAQSKKEQIEFLKLRVDSLNSLIDTDRNNYSQYILKLNSKISTLKTQNDSLSSIFKISSDALTKKELEKEQLKVALNKQIEDINILIKGLEMKSDSIINLQKKVSSIVSRDSSSKTEFYSNQYNILETAIPFFGIIELEGQYDGTWDYSIKINDGKLKGINNLYLMSGFDDPYKIECDCPEYGILKEGDKVIGFAVKSKCKIESNKADSITKTEICYRPILVKKM